jgi:hypothetical protein
VSQRLLDEAKRRLNAALPHDVRVRAGVGAAPGFYERDEIWVGAERLGPVYESSSQGGFRPDQVRSILINLLLEAQTVIWNSGGGGWPTTNPEPASIDDLPKAWVAVTPTEIRLWYGNADQPTLALEPIPTGDL